MNTFCLKRHISARPIRVSLLAAGLVIAMPMAACIALAQEPAAIPSKMTTPAGYSAHHSVDVGGRVANKVGSGAMYNTMVNLQSGPRVNGESMDLHKLPTNKHALVDDARITGSGFGGDPYNFAKLAMSKAGRYEFNGTFRRNRQYFDYNLLGNPNLPSGISVPIGPSATPTGSLAWPQVQHSSVMTNSVRRMTDTDLMLFPQSKLSLRLSYSQNIMQGPSLLPSRSGGILKYSALLAAVPAPLDRRVRGCSGLEAGAGHQSSPSNSVSSTTRRTATSRSIRTDSWRRKPTVRRSTWATGIWSATDRPHPRPPLRRTAPRLATRTASSTQRRFCIRLRMAACRSSIRHARWSTSYQRTNPYRLTLPSETLRFQSNSIKNLSFNGQASYSWTNLNMPNYYESAWGLNANARNQYFSASGSGKREVYSADFGMVWQATKNFSLADQVSLMANAQPGSSTISSYTKLATPTTAGSQTINYSGALTSSTGASMITGISSGTNSSYFGNEQLTNNLTAAWTPTPRTNFSLTYRWSNRNIGLNIPIVLRDSNPLRLLRSPRTAASSMALIA